MRSRAALAAATPVSTDREDPDFAGLDIEMLNASVGYMLRRAQLAVFADFGETLAELRLRPGQFAALAVIDRNHGMTQSGVCAALGIHRTNFVGVINDLEKRGLVQRTSSATDRRTKALALTAGGRRALERAAELQRTHEARIGRWLGRGGREQLLQLLARLDDFTSAVRATEPR